jgi:hypothetical protein
VWQRDTNQTGVGEVQDVEQVILGRQSNIIQKDLMTAIDASSDCASEQTAEVIRLTRSLNMFTWVLVAVGLIQLLLVLVKGV